MEAAYEAKITSTAYDSYSGESTTHEYTSGSEGSGTFEHRYLFEGRTYRFTGEPEGNRIIFRIVPQ